MDLLGFLRGMKWTYRLLLWAAEAEEDECDPSNPIWCDDPSAAVLGLRCLETLNDSLRLMETTVVPKTFFGRYEGAVSCAQLLAEIDSSDGGKMINASLSEKVRVRKVLDDLMTHRSEKICSFADRCRDRGNLYAIREELLSGQYDIPEDAKAYIEKLVHAIEADTDDAPESGEYIYCSVSFSPGGKTYYYKTVDKTLKCGDCVTVPVGREGRTETAKIEKIERFPVRKTPYPPKLTKDILGKYSDA